VEQARLFSGSQHGRCGHGRSLVPSTGGVGTVVFWFPARAGRGLEEKRCAVVGERRGGGGHRREQNLRRKSVAVIRSANNGFHGGVLKNNKLKKKKLLCAFVCLS